MVIQLWTDDGDELLDDIQINKHLSTHPNSDLALEALSNFHERINKMIDNARKAGYNDR